jgi:ectoine hydroxylase-related dioxygenase (phytanoyl-CoA dioxygenase family)
MGALEVLPGSHRPDTFHGSPGSIGRAVDSPDDPACGVVPIAVPAGTVTIYSSRAWHRGSASQSEQERVFCFLTVMEPDSPSAPGLIHTMELDDVGEWAVCREGLSERGV